jgi:translocator protein
LNKLLTASYLLLFQLIAYQGLSKDIISVEVMNVIKTSKTFLSGNILALTVVVIVNTLAVLLPINRMSTGKISDLYPSLFTPAGFTFSIWSVIYLGLISFTVAQFKYKDKPYFKELSLWFLLSCFANVCWILVWHYLFTTASLIIMLVLLFSLTRIFILLHQTEIKNRVEHFFIRVPFVIYLAWICVATIANASALLVSLNWSGGTIAPEHWTVVMITAAGLLGLVVAYKFEEPFFLLVLIWAFFGIYSKWVEGDYQLIAMAARIGGIVLAIVAGKLLVSRIQITKTSK